MKQMKRKSLFLLFLITVTVTINFHPVSAQDTPVAANYETVKRQMVTLIKKQMKANKVTGLSIALVDDQEVVWSQGFGYANLETKSQVTQDTLFRIGSISKLFTATAIMRLVEAGKIDLDQPLQRYIPEFAIKSRFHHAGLISIRSLLTHHSGLPGDLLQGWHSTTTPEYFTSILANLKSEYVAYPPNYIYAYSNLGFSLLGIVIERVTGQTFNDYLKTEILKPLEMNYSSFLFREAMRPNLAAGYFGEIPSADPLIRDLPAGSMYSSANELGNFVKTVFAAGRFHNYNLLTKVGLTRMLTPQNHGIPLDLDIRLGLAWHLFDPTGLLGHAGKVAWHNGGLDNFHSFLITLPEHKLGVIVLSNSLSGAQIIDGIAGNALRLALEAKTGHKAPDSKPKYLPEHLPDQTELKAIEGCYATQMGIIKVHTKDSAWFLRAQGHDFSLKFHEGRWLSIPELFGPATYYQVGQIGTSKVIIAKTASSDFKQVIGEAVSAKPLPEVWKNRCGKYRVSNDPFLAATPFEISIDENNLLTLGDALTLTPLSDDEALINGLGRGMRETVRCVRTNGREVIFYSGLRLEKLPESLPKGVLK